MPFEALADMAVGGSRGSAMDGGGTSWDLMFDGALPMLCDLIEAPCDPDTHCYSLSSLSAALSLHYAAAQSQVIVFYGSTSTSHQCSGSYEFSNQVTGQSC